MNKNEVINQVERTSMLIMKSRVALAIIGSLVTGGVSLTAYADPDVSATTTYTARHGDVVNPPSKVGTVTDWNWYEGIDVSKDGVDFHQKHFSYMTATGPVVGIVTDIVFTLDAPARIVWKYMKDPNTYQGPFGIKYTGAWGELHTSEEQTLGKRTMQYGSKDGRWMSVPSEVIKVIPQHQLTLYETVPSDGSSGGVSPGFHTELFTEFGNKTIVTMVFQHTARETGMKSEIEAVRKSQWGPLNYHHEQARKWWIDQMPPLLKKFVAEDADNIALKRTAAGKH